MRILMVLALSVCLSGCFSTALLVVDATLTVAKLANEIHQVKKNKREKETWNDPGLDPVENTKVAMNRDEK